LAPATLDELRSLLGAGGYLDAPADIEPFLVDHRRRYRGDAPLVALPDSTASVSALMRRCTELGVAVVPHGGNTSYCGAATPRRGGREIVLSLRRMSRIRGVEPAGNSITVEAGCILHEVQAAAEAVDRLFPMSLGSEGSCTIGGNLSTNAGGTAVLRYGMMRDLVLGLEVVLPDGRVLDQLRALRKDNTGYDLKHLFVGAEGSLGIITAACLKLFPRPRGYATAFVALADPAAAVRLLDRLRTSLGDTVTTFELVPRLALELTCRHVPAAATPSTPRRPGTCCSRYHCRRIPPGSTTALEARLAADLEAGELQDATSRLARPAGVAVALRESIPEAQTREGASLKHDISLETRAVPAFVEAGGALLERLPGFRLVAYGHLGDGNLHFNLSAPAGGDDASFLARGGELRRAVHDLVASYRGSFSAEHGIGQDKVAELERYEDPVALDLMRGIKRLLDPQGIMNPGKVLRDEPEGAAVSM
jgi:FAD/FMN-containing dehydrogenase